MDIRYGSNYKDKNGNIYRLVGNAKPMGKGDKILTKDANFEPVSKYF